MMALMHHEALFFVHSSNPQVGGSSLLSKIRANFNKGRFNLFFP
jgi:hypothetical protein